MELKVSFDADAALAKLNEVRERAEGFRDAMPAEFSDWQEHDMGRRRADTQAPAPHSVFTIILQRGRPPVIARSTRPARRPPQRRLRSQKPILRPELFDQLRERMSELLKRTFVPWR